MPDYRRWYHPGGTWFFTVALQHRGSRLLIDEVDRLRAAIASTKARHPFTINALVILPDHLHAVLTLPADDTEFPRRWRHIKAMFSRSLPPNEWRSAVNVRRRERGIWQRRYWEHLIRSDEDFVRHIEYCHFNPVRHGFVRAVRDWPYSTFHRDVKNGLYPADWGSA